MTEAATTSATTTVDKNKINQDAMDVDNTDEEAEGVVVENVYNNKRKHREESSEDGEEQVPASTGAENETTTASSNKNGSNNTADLVVFSPELLQVYYSRLFPYDMLYQWLSYGGSSSSNNNRIFRHREFSFTIEPKGGGGGEIYLRYQSFANCNELKTAIQKRHPIKIDIGAVFTNPPIDKNTLSTNKNIPESRELVFDIDLTDYDDVRKCGCSGANICTICWKFMNMAVQVMDDGLRQDFGFHNIAWFYSGRRGVHCWVCDANARELTDHGRSAIASYFEVNLGTDKNKEVHLSDPIHPMLTRAYDSLKPMFVEHVLPDDTGHGLLASESSWTELLDTLPDSASRVRDHLLREWTRSLSTPEEKWKQLEAHLQAFLKAGSSGSGNSNNKAAKQMTNKERTKIVNWTYETVFKYTYPRLDINVSKMRNHLLKSPFCVHPKTGRVCVPISDIELFNPFAVPTLSQLMKELDQNTTTDSSGNDEDDGGRPDWAKTSLKTYFEGFQKDFLEPLCKGIRLAKRDAEEKQAALVGDF